jgi:neutral ceramidase
MHFIARFIALVVLLAASVYAQQFKAGTARMDITPEKPVPMWGYGARHDALSQGVRDPLYAKAVVLDFGADKLAIVGLDLGRSPMADMMARIREAVKERAGVDYVLMSGSHTHHGPVLELADEDGKGKGKFDDGVAYLRDLESKLIDVIIEAAGKVQDARMGWGAKNIDMNRNRHTKLEPKPVDPELNVIRFDDLGGKPIALIVNYNAHPTMLPTQELKFSAEYPGQMMLAVEEALGVHCQFMQGSAGDMSVKTTPETNTIETYGRALARHVIEAARGIETRRPDAPSIQAMDEDFPLEPRLDFSNAMILGMFRQAFFPELVNRFLDELGHGTITPHLTTVMLNRELALVGGSGEFFCQHSNRLKERSRVKTIFFGYCNGHHMYFPTIEATAEGGYGADATVSYVPLGAGEMMMDRALINIYTMLGKYEDPLGLRSRAGN